MNLRKPRLFNLFAITFALAAALLVSTGCDDGTEDPGTGDTTGGDTAGGDTSTDTSTTDTSTTDTSTTDTTTTDTSTTDTSTNDTSTTDTSTTDTTTTDTTTTDTTTTDTTTDTTADTVEPTGTCAEYNTCLNACTQGDMACSDACAAETSDEGLAAFNAIIACAQANQCSGDTFNECLDANCGPELDVCFPPMTGDLTCGGIFTCFDTCAEGDQPCYQACYNDGTAQAQEQYGDIFACTDANGCDTAPEGFQQCAADNCGPELDACFGPPPMGTATCDEIFLCFDGCTQGDQACLQACYGEGTAEAQDQYDAIATCSAANSCDTAADANQCLLDNCDPEVTACFGGFCVTPCASNADCTEASTFCEMNAGACAAGDSTAPTFPPTAAVCNADADCTNGQVCISSF